jgi:phage replication O-like protein O
VKRAAPPERTGGDASPQTGKGHGHTEFSNELLEAAYRFAFTGPQIRIVLAVIRDSYGWKRKVALPRLLCEWSVELNMPHSTVHRAIRELVDLGVVEYDTATGGLALVKNYRAWGATPLLPLELSTAGDRIVDNSASLIGIPTAGNPTDGIPTGGIIPSTGGIFFPASGTPYGERKLKKKERGADGARPAPKDLPNGKTDTPTNRAALGHWEWAPQDHPGFARLSFKLQDALADQWRETAEAERKRTACKKCQTRPRASDAWAYCRPCTVCRVCNGAADGTRKFQTGPEGVICTKCVGDLSTEF